MNPSLDVYLWICYSRKEGLMEVMDKKEGDVEEKKDDSIAFFFKQKTAYEIGQ